jgi:hypothetical protein
MRSLFNRLMVAASMAALPLPALAVAASSNLTRHIDVRVVGAGAAADGRRFADVVATNHGGRPFDVHLRCDLLFSNGSPSVPGGARAGVMAPGKTWSSRIWTAAPARIDARTGAGAWNCYADEVATIPQPSSWTRLLRRWFGH